MTAIVRSTNRAVPMADPAGADRLSGIDKRAVLSLEVFEPGPNYGDGPGVVDDLVGDSEHHGGAQKAVYAFSREQLDVWERRLDRRLPDGAFGENLTTSGIDLERLELNTRLDVGGDVVLEVSVPRTPCRTFAARMGIGGWMKQFIAHGRCGIYLRVVTPGTITAGDPIVVDEASIAGHGIDMITAFAASAGHDDSAAARVVAARCLPAMYHDRLVRRLAVGDLTNSR